MSAGMLGVPIYYIVVGWIAHSRPTYMLAGMLGACIIISGPKHYMWLKDIISAKIGWNAICSHLTHMKIHLMHKILTEVCGTHMCDAPHLGPTQVPVDRINMTCSVAKKPHHYMHHLVDKPLLK